MIEIWKDIPEYEGLYQVSNLGNIRSFYLKNGRLSQKTKPIKLKKDRYGYLKLTLCKNKKYKYVTIHRLVAEAFIPNPENKLQVNHKDGNKFNNQVSNLEWCTCIENIHHAFNIGLRKKKGVK